MIHPIRIYIGGTAEHDLPTRVLEFSIRRHTSHPVEVHRLWECPLVSVQPKKRTPTSFSLQRFLIPEWCNFEGRGIYMDSDMVVCADIAEVWETALPDHAICATPPGWQSAVMLWDCAKAKAIQIARLVEQLDAETLGYSDLMNLRRSDLTPRYAGLDRLWNATDRDWLGALPPGTKNIHYTDMRAQPWLKAGHRWEDQWLSELMLAIESHEIEDKDVELSIANGWVRPSLSMCIGMCPPRPDSEFTPPNDLRV